MMLVSINFTQKCQVSNANLSQILLSLLCMTVGSFIWSLRLTNLAYLVVSIAYC